MYTRRFAQNAKVKEHKGEEKKKQHRSTHRPEDDTRNEANRKERRDLHTTYMRINRMRTEELKREKKTDTKKIHI